MRCQYCFYADVAAHRRIPNYGVMTPDTMRALVRRAFIYADSSVAFSFQGGEPTLAGIEYFQSFLREVHRCNSRHLPVSYALQTNGYAVSDEMLALFAEHHFLLGVSLDGPEDMHDALRKDVGGRGTYRRVMHTIEKLRHLGIPYNILCVVTAETTRRSQETWNALREHQYLQFIPCIDGLDGSRNPYSLSPDAYGHFLIDIFDAYERAFKEGNPVSERRLDNYLSILAGFAPEECGMCGQCGLYYLAEADGSVYPCDFYMVDKYRLGSVFDNSFAEMFCSDTAKKFTAESYPLPDECNNCKYRRLCGGGCRRENRKYCLSYRGFFDKNHEKLAELAMKTAFPSV